MMLGEFECDEDTAYFLKNGKYPKKTNTYKPIESMPLDNDDELYRLFHEANWEEYMDWAKTYRFCYWH